MYKNYNHCTRHFDSLQTSKNILLQKTFCCFGRSCGLEKLFEPFIDLKTCNICVHFVVKDLSCMFLDMVRDINIL